jgi:hypothetical protein
MGSPLKLNWSVACTDLSRQEKQAGELWNSLLNSKLLAVGLTLGGEPEVDLFGFSDAAYLTKGDSLLRLAYCFFLNLTSACICTRSSKNSTVSHSSTEAELKALDDTIRQVVWLRNFLAEFTDPQSKPTVIYVDSKSSIAISETGSNFGHIMMRIKYIYQEVLAKTVEVKYKLRIILTRIIKLRTFWPSH